MALAESQLTLLPGASPPCSVHSRLLQGRPHAPTGSFHSTEHTAEDGCPCHKVPPLLWFYVVFFCFTLFFRIRSISHEDRTTILEQAWRFSMYRSRVGCKMPTDNCSLLCFIKPANVKTLSFQTPRYPERELRPGENKWLNKAVTKSWWHLRSPASQVNAV